MAGNYGDDHWRIAKLTIDVLLAVVWFYWRFSGWWYYTSAKFATITQTSSKLLMLASLGTCLEQFNLSTIQSNCNATAIQYTTQQIYYPAKLRNPQSIPPNSHNANTTSNSQSTFPSLSLSPISYCYEVE